MMILVATIFICGVLIGFNIFYNFDENEGEISEFELKEKKMHKM